MTGFRVGVDIGGTFTDIVFLGEAGERITRKVSSTVDDYAAAIADGLGQILAECRPDGAEILELLHGTTVASNAILERKGARTGLITTKGFRDVLEIRTLRFPRLYDLSWTKPPPLVERQLRVEVGERINASGEVLIPLAVTEIERALDRLLRQRVEAIAVCLLHSYANPAHEQLVEEVARRLAPGLPLCLSSEVLPEIREYERTSTTVINAYVKPIVEKYLSSLVARLSATGIGAPLLLMQSNGGLTTAQSAAEKPIHIVESGPAAGVVGVRALARQLGIADAIAFDMGGTTAKASLIEGGEVSRAHEYAVGGGVMVGSRLLSGAGYTLKVPAIDLAEVGAGGGSILWIDKGGALQVGPMSAGAAPGPVCYDRGGSAPTVTDANLVLGYLNPRYLVGGALPLDPRKARAALEREIAQPLGIGVDAAAHGAFLIAASNMIRAIKAVSSERGRDPRQMTLVAFGGNGPVFAAAMAAALKIERVLIPPSAGVFSSFGLLYSEVEHHFSQTRKALIRSIDPAEFGAILERLETAARERLLADGFAPAQIVVARAAALRYQGQSFELEVRVPDGAIDRPALLALEEAFGGEHERTYGHRAGPEEPIELMTLKVVGRGLSDPPRAALAARAALPQRVVAAPGARPAYFGATQGWLETRILDRADLAAPRRGPCIIEEYDSTCVVPPGAEAALDRLGNITIRVPAA
jgi:N-methylhydantoinase A